MFSMAVSVSQEALPNQTVLSVLTLPFCVGAPLARLEARIALPMLLEQLRGL